MKKVDLIVGVASLVCFATFIYQIVNELTAYDKDVLHNYCIKKMNCTVESYEAINFFCSELSDKLMSNKIDYATFETIIAKEKCNKE